MIAESGRIALVTGGGSGIGKAVALALAGCDYQVTTTGRTVSRLRDACAEAEELGRRIECIPSDVSDPESVDNLFRAIRDRYGRLDLLFNNAGQGGHTGSVATITLEQWRTAVDTNLTGTFLCTQQAFRMMMTQSPRGGRIINNGSLSAHVPRPNSPAYTATKHGISGLTKSTSLDGRDYNIACGQIDIGNAATDRTDRAESGILQANGSLMIEPRISVEEVARAVLYMAALPLSANIQSMTVMATTMPYIGRG